MYMSGNYREVWTLGFKASPLQGLQRSLEFKVLVGVQLTLKHRFCKHDFSPNGDGGFHSHFKVSNFILYLAPGFPSSPCYTELCFLLIPRNGAEIINLH